MTFPDPVVAGTTLVREAIQSPNFVSGSTGWSINQDGSAEFDALTARGDIIISNASVGTISVEKFIEWQLITNSIIRWDDLASDVTINSSSATALGGGLNPFGGQIILANPGDLGADLLFEGQSMYFESRFDLDLDVTVADSASTFVFELAIDGVVQPHQLVQRATTATREPKSRSWFWAASGAGTYDLSVTGRRVGGAGVCVARALHTTILTKSIGGSVF